MSELLSLLSCRRFQPGFSTLTCENGEHGSEEGNAETAVGLPGPRPWHAWQESESGEGAHLVHTLVDEEH